VAAQHVLPHVQVARWAGELLQGGVEAREGVRLLRHAYQRYSCPRHRLQMVPSWPRPSAGHSLLIRGSSASRMASPRRLKPTTETKIASPGNSDSHGAREACL